MPTYTTPTPIDVAIHLPVGAIEIVASDRSDTVVTVTPTNPAKAVDRRGAEETTVDFAAQRLTITGPKPRFSFIGPSESVDVRVELPAGSRLTAEGSMGGVRTVGRLGATRIKCSMGPVDVDSTGRPVAARRARQRDRRHRGRLGSRSPPTTGRSGVGTVTGDAVLKASHGSVQVGESGGDLDARLSYGDLEITRALGSVTTKTSYGSIQLHEISSGSIQVESGYGQITLGVRDGVPAWLDLSSKSGHVRNQLEGNRAPDESEQSVAVRARTQAGNITVQRAR